MQVAENALWGDSVLVQDFDSDMHTSGARINAEIGCGFSAWDEPGLLKPFGGVVLSETQDDRFDNGGRLSFGSDVELELKGTRTPDSEEVMQDQIRFNGGLKW